MKTQTHGLSIDIGRVGNELLLSLKAVGKLTHEDYETITPLIDAALAGVTEPKIKAIIDGTGMEGWEWRAAWDDFRLVLKHGKEFGKVAIFGNKNWQEFAAKIGSWFVSGQVRYFRSEAEALAWLTEE